MFRMAAFGLGKSGTKKGQRMGTVDPWDDLYGEVAGGVVRFNGEMQQGSSLDAWLRGFL